MEYATRDKVEAAIEDMPDRFLECRDFAHRWTSHTASWDATTSTFDRALRCTRCKTIKRQVLSRSGSILQSAYDYTEGYLLKDIGRIVSDGRDAVRLASVMRRLNGEGPS